MAGDDADGGWVRVGGGRAGGGRGGGRGGGGGCRVGGGGGVEGGGVVSPEKLGLSTGIVYSQTSRSNSSRDRKRLQSQHHLISQVDTVLP